MEHMCADVLTKKMKILVTFSKHQPSVSVNNVLSVNSKTIMKNIRNCRAKFKEENKEEDDTDCNNLD